MKTLHIAVGSDHNGFQLKEIIKQELIKHGYTVKDFGQSGEEPSAQDFLVAEEVALSVVKKETKYGILICGTGAGMSIAANKIPGCFAALCFSIFTAEVARGRNNANVLALGSKTVDAKLAKEILNVWLNTDFDGKKSDIRNYKRNLHLKELDKKYRAVT